MKKYKREVIKEGNSLILKIQPKKWYLWWLCAKAIIMVILKTEHKNAS